MHNYRYFKENVDKKEKIDFFRIGRLKESLPFAPDSRFNSLTRKKSYDSLIALNIEMQCGREYICKRDTENILWETG